MIISMWASQAPIRDDRLRLAVIVEHLPVEAVLDAAFGRIAACARRQLPGGRANHSLPARVNRDVEAQIGAIGHKCPPKEKCPARGPGKGEWVCERSYSAAITCGA